MSVIEINGSKFDVDFREAKEINTFKVGDKVKVLKKKYLEHVVYPGIIVGFEQFQKLPTIVIAYLDGYNQRGMGLINYCAVLLNNKYQILQQRTHIDLLR